MKTLNGGLPFVHPKRAYCKPPTFMRLHLIITGHVQGVFFRSRTKARARALQVNGWCKNNSDGTFEVVFEGDEDKLKKLLLWCKKGPEGAQVTSVEEHWEDEEGIVGFEIR